MFRREGTIWVDCMGMFDDIICKYPLPIEGANDLRYQTKDTPDQYLRLFKIEKDGTLWVEEYDTEDQSKAGKWRAENPGKEPPDNFSWLDKALGCMARVNKRWKQVLDFTGEICFYTSLPPDHSGWIEWSAYFEDGKVVRLNLIEYRK